MDNIKLRWKKKPIRRAWVRCRSLKSGHIKSKAFTKSKSWNCTTTSSMEDKKWKSKWKVAPEGCFSVNVGPEKQRFIVKTEFANHPLFKMLLEDAEIEYGYHSQGPILLPCDVDLFYKVLAEMDSSTDDADIGRPSCSFGKGYGSFIPCSPVHLPRSSSNTNIGTYKLLSPSPMLKLNKS